MSNQLVRQAFETALAAWAASRVPALPVAYENAPFDPPDGLAYAEAYMLPADTRCDTLDGTHRRYSGVFQVSLLVPAGVGPGAVEALAQSLDAAFPLTAPLSAGGLNVYLLSPMGAAPAVQRGDRYSVPVSASYRADLVP